MICLKCRSQMQKTIFEGVLIDFCPDCQSFWLDNNEFEDIVKGKDFDSKALLEEVTEERKEESERKVEWHDIIACPKCMSGKISRHRMLGLELERCEICNGIFFDKDELKFCYDKAKENFLYKIWTHIKKLL